MAGWLNFTEVCGLCRLPMDRASGLLVARFCSRAADAGIMDEKWRYAAATPRAQKQNRTYNGRQTGLFVVTPV